MNSLEQRPLLLGEDRILFFMGRGFKLNTYFQSGDTAFSLTPKEYPSFHQFVSTYDVLNLVMMGLIKKEHLLENYRWVLTDEGHKVNLKRKGEYAY